VFPGYLFCRMNPHNRLPVLQTPGVIQIVGVGKSPIPVEDRKIAAIQCAEKSGSIGNAVALPESWSRRAN